MDTMRQTIFQRERWDEEKKLQKILGRSNTVLFKASSVFPFDFFPDDLTIDENKVNIINREFFLSEDVHSVLIEMIKDVHVESSVLFATLQIVPEGYPNAPMEVKYLKKSDAFRARRILQGLMVCLQEKIDLSKIDPEELQKKFEDVGKIKPVEH